MGRHATGQAEFQRLRTSGRAYRVETVVEGDQQGREEIFEFVPPDRMRLKYRFKEGADWVEFVRVGDRVWDHEKELPVGWPTCSMSTRSVLGGLLGRLNVLGRSSSRARPTRVTEPIGCSCRRVRSLQSGELTGARFSSIGRRGRWPTKLLRWRSSSASRNGASATPTPTTQLFALHHPARQHASPCAPPNRGAHQGVAGGGICPRTWRHPGFQGGRMGGAASRGKAYRRNAAN